MKNKFYLKWPFISTIVLLILCICSVLYMLDKPKESQNQVTETNIQVTNPENQNEKFIAVLITDEETAKISEISKSFEKVSKMTALKETFNFSLKDLYDSSLEDLIYMYNINKTPTLLILDKEGTLLKKVTDDINEQELLLSLNSVLEK